MTIATPFAARRGRANPNVLVPSGNRLTPETLATNHGGLRGPTPETRGGMACREIGHRRNS